MEACTEINKLKTHSARAGQDWNCVSVWPYCSAVLMGRVRMLRITRPFAWTCPAGTHTSEESPVDIIKMLKDNGALMSNKDSNCK